MPQLSINPKCSIYPGIVYATISMCILRSLWVYYDLYGCTSISIGTLLSLVYYNLYGYTTVSMCIP